MRYLLVLVALTGCAAQVPVNLGDGRFAQIVSADGSVFSQIDAENNAACLQEASAGYRQIVNLGSRVYCSTQDISEKLPVSASVYSEVNRKPIKVHVKTMLMCYESLENTPKSDVIKGCASSR